MLSWIRKKFLPQPVSIRISEANPGKSLQIFSTSKDASKSPRLEIDTLDVLARVLQDANRRYTRRSGWIILPEGVVLIPGIVSLEKPKPGLWHVASTIETLLPEPVAARLWEYQHGFGETPAAASAKGFQSWAQLDLPVLLDALQATPQSCTALQIKLPADGIRPARARRVLFGPVSHTVTNALPAEESEEHPFCVCCMFTRLRELLRDRLDDGATHGIRFFAYRSEEGEIKADCRLNGLDWPEGIAALREYAATWKQQGDEIRKQYVLIQTGSPL